MFSKSSKFREIAKNPFTYKERVRRERARAVIAEQQASPTLDFGGVTIINPVYCGPNPYRGPELSDPKNAGNTFIPIRRENIPRARANGQPSVHQSSRAW